MIGLRTESVDDRSRKAWGRESPQSARSRNRSNSTPIRPT